MNCDLCGNKICDSAECLFDSLDCPMFGTVKRSMCYSIVIDSHIRSDYNVCSECNKAGKNKFKKFKDMPAWLQDKILTRDL